MTSHLRTQISLGALRRNLAIDRSAGLYIITVRALGDAHGTLLAYATCRGLRITSKEPQFGLATHMLWAEKTDNGNNVVAFDITTEEAHRLADWLGVNIPPPLALALEAHA